MIIRVRTGSRLHFGLLSLPGDKDSSGPATRVWGGAGLMIEQPGVDLEAQPAPRWSANGPLAERILDLIQRFEKSFPLDGPTPLRLHFHLHNQPLEHQGLGTGTQLALAVARILAEYFLLHKKFGEDLAGRVSRGLRSALGIHGFDHGGFLVDGGKSARDQLAPLVARAAFPEDWRIVLMLFPSDSGQHGSRETQSFEELSRRHAALDTDRLCRLVLLGMLPALAERDLSAFGEALYEFNRRVGEAFAPVQGGIYAHPSAADIVDFVRRQKVPGVGQSSWGPALFAIVESEDRAKHLAEQLRGQFPFKPNNVLITQAANHGARVDRSGE